VIQDLFYYRVAYIASEEAKQLQTEINEMKVSADQYRSDLVYSGLHVLI
jgi:hypothetical protein